MNISDRMQGILQKLKGNISDEERRVLMKEKFQVMSEPQTYSEGGVIYRADGGIAGFEDQEEENVQQGLPDFVEKKLREALGAGVNPDDIQGVLKNNALKSRNARVRGALLGSGLAALGKVNENVARGLAGAEHGTAAPVYDSALGTVGQGLKEEGAANAKYHDEITRLDEAQALKTEKDEKKQMTEGAALQSMYISSAQALGFLDRGWKAIFAYQEARAKASRIFGTALLLPGSSADSIAKREDQYIEQWIRKQVEEGKLEETAVSAYSQLEATITELTTSALDALGPGPKTDFDFIVAGRTITDLEKTPNTIAEMLTRLIEKAKYWMAEKGITPKDVVVPNTPNIPAKYDRGQWAPVEELDTSFGAKVKDKIKDKLTPDDFTLTLDDGTIYQTELVDKADVPKDVRGQLKNGFPKTFGTWKRVTIWQSDDGIIYVYGDIKGDKRPTRRYFTATLVEGE